MTGPAGVNRRVAIFRAISSIVGVLTAAGEPLPVYMQLAGGLEGRCPYNITEKFFWRAFHVDGERKVHGQLRGPSFISFGCGPRIRHATRLPGPTRD